MFRKLCLILVAFPFIGKINYCKAACTPPDPPEDGTVIGTPTIQTARGLAYAVGDTVKFVCNPGFGLAGAEDAICQGDGQFSEDPPFCAAITCKRPQIENGIIVATFPPGGSPPPAGVYRAGTTVTLRCNPGFTSDGRTSKCQDTGQWSPSLAPCKHASARCPVPPTPPNSQVVSKSPVTGDEADGFVPGSFIEYRCNPGYETTDSEQIVCLIDGMWSENPPVCTEASQATGVVCHAFALQNGQVIPDKQQYRVGDTASVTCNDGYAISPIESAFLMCIEGGQWSPAVGVCVARATANRPTATTTTSAPQPAIKASFCPARSVTFGEIWPTSAAYEIGTMVTLFCNPGFKVTPVDSDWSMCQTSGTWYPEIGTCNPEGRTTTERIKVRPDVTNITCKMPTSSPHTRVVLSRSALATPGSSLLAVGTRLVYACEEGYFLTDDYYQTAAASPLQITIECLDNGNWSHVPPSCRLNENTTGGPALDAAQVTELFKTPYWNNFGSEPTARFRACAWGAVAEVLPDPDSRYRAIAVCASGIIMSISSTCLESYWKAVIGPPRGIVGWSQDPFYAADIDLVRRQLYLTSSVKKLGILQANLDVIIAAGLREATVQPQYLVAGTRNGPQFEGVIVDSDSRLIYSADGASSQVSVWSLIDGWPFAKISRSGGSPSQTFQPRRLALSAAGGRQNRKLLAVSDYVNNVLSLFLINKENISSSEYVGTVASYAGRCEVGSIGRPGRITFDHAGNIIVADGGCGRTQIFGADLTTGRQPFLPVWASKNLGQYVGSVVPLLARNKLGDAQPALMAALNSGEVVCFISGQNI